MTDSKSPPSPPHRASDRSSINEVASPCVRNCCLNQQDVCLGCFRTLDEILAWSAATNTERKEILVKTLERRLERGK